MYVRKLDKKIHLYFTFMCQIRIHFGDENRLSSLHRSDKFAQTSLAVGILLWLLVVSVSIDFFNIHFPRLLFCLDSPMGAPSEDRVEGWHLFHRCFCSSCRRPSPEISYPSCRRPGPLRLSPPLSQPRPWWPAKLTHGSFVNFPEGPGQKVEEGGRSCQRGLDQQPTQLSAPPK